MLQSEDQYSIDESQQLDRVFGDHSARVILERNLPRLIHVVEELMLLFNPPRS
jgi:hypothetical protein